MAGGDAGATVGHQVFQRALPTQLVEALAQGGRRKEAAIAIQVVGEYSALRAGNMPGDRVERLDLATKARQCTCVEQGQIRVAQALGQMIGSQQQAAVGLRGKIAGGLLGGVMVSS